jgi:asparagine synthase (glutamine-hydrolysing)
MCGIAGTVEAHGAFAEPARLETMLSVLSHRGPDEQGVCACAEVGLAHARLSIIDIVGGRQPMSIKNGRFWIVFNGEIFNYPELREELIQRGHHFATRSDTEVILHLYEEKGEACVDELNGQWAFAIWDTSLHKLFLSRDRMGVRPLYYAQTARGFRFASEIKALLAYPDVPCELDLQGLDQIFTYWVTLPPRTAFRGVRQLPPGHSLVLENGDIRIQQYWNLRYQTTQEPSVEDEGALTEELLALLLDATRIRLRADVPVGAYLSGGIDSTFITALARSLVGDRLRTFSIGFHDEEFDESGYQHEASSFLGTHHSDIRCNGEEIARVFPMVVWHAEQPVLRTAPAPMFLLAQLVRQSGFKVVLTGEGADEMLGGYDILKETKIRQFWARNPSSPWRPLLLKRLYPYLPGIQSQSPAYLKGFFHVSEGDLANPYFSHLPRWNVTARLKSLLSVEARAELESDPGTADLDAQMPEGFASWAVFHRAEYLEAKYLLPGYILSSQGDRMAMAHGVEGRYPFLDHRVVEFAANLPPNFKMKALDEKHILKQAAAGWIPESIRKRYKRPYSAPGGSTLLQDTEGYGQYLLSADSIRNWNVFDPASVESLVGKFQSGRAFSTKDNMALVAVLSTQMLLDQFMARRTPSLSNAVPASSAAEIRRCA